MNKQEIIANILPSVVLSPSAHNTQPWLFDVQDGRLDIYVDPSRRLKVSDPADRQLYISLGCAITNARIAAGHHHYQIETVYFPEGETEGSVIARLALQSGSNTSDSHELFSAINQRRSDRALYDGQPLTPHELAKMPALNSQNVVAVRDKKRIEELGEIISQGTFETLSRKDFREELSHWVRSNWTRKPDGMPGYAMGIPAPITPLLPWAVKILPIHRQEQTNTGQQARSASIMVVISSEKDSPRDWLVTGELMERVWLEATAAGLAVAPLAAAIEAGEALRRRTQAVIKTNNLPHAALRIGHSPRKNVKASPRRSVADCLKQAS